MLHTYTQTHTHTHRHTHIHTDTHTHTVTKRLIERGALAKNGTFEKPVPATIAKKMMKGGIFKPPPLISIIGSKLHQLRTWPKKMNHSKNMMVSSSIQLMGI